MKMINSGITPEKAVEKALTLHKGKYIIPNQITENNKNIFKAQWSNGNKEMWILVTYEKAGWRMMLNGKPDFGPIRMFEPHSMKPEEIIKNIVALFDFFEQLYGKVV